MDDIVDLEIEHVTRIIKKIEKDPESESIKRTELDLWNNVRNKAVQGRRTGLGITAEGDMLAALGFVYGSGHANDVTENVHKFLAINAFKTSVELAKERGTFHIYDREKEVDSPFLNRLFDESPELKSDMLKYGRRNIAILTIAPTGTTSMMTQTTSGIEPVFMVSYKRRKKVNPNDTDHRVDFVDELGDEWQEFQVFHHHFKTWLTIKGYDVSEVEKMDDVDLVKIIKKSPYYKATANDVDWLSKVHMQGRIQKWIDHSISVTVNVPNEVTVDLVDKIYRTGHQVGCKGITVYRDGSRSGVLVSSDDDGKNTKIIFADNHAPKRTKHVQALLIRFQNALDPWIAIVGIMEDRPYEIFTGKVDALTEIPKSIDKGIITKTRGDSGSRYDFSYINSDGTKTVIEGISSAFNKEYYNYAKLISGVMRHGMPLESIIDLVSSLRLNDDLLNTWKNGVVRVLKRFVEDGTESSNECPECKQHTLVFSEGCLTCSSCGHSKCG